MPKGGHLKELNAKGRLDIVGEKFNRLTVLHQDGHYSGSLTYMCKCECGNLIGNIVASEIYRGRRKSCGCDKGAKNPNRKQIIKDRILSRTKKNGECWEWMGSLNRCGYGQIKLQKKHYMSHRLAYEMFVGEITEKMIVMHICDNRKCVNPSHLFLGTHSDNTRDMCKKNRQTGHGKMNAEYVREIRKSYPQTPVKRLSEKYEVSECCIYNILNNVTWKFA